MLEKFTYTNHLGEVITFGEAPYFASRTDLRDYKWTHDSDITRFSRDTVTKTLEVILVGTEEDANKAKDTLYEIFEKDVLAMKKGTFQIGDKVGCHHGSQAYGRTNGNINLTHHNGHQHTAADNRINGVVLQHGQNIGCGHEIICKD